MIAATPDNDIWHRIHRKAAAQKAVRSALDEALDALDACEDYFEERMDADCIDGAFVPNREMQLHTLVLVARKLVEAARETRNV